MDHKEYENNMIEGVNRNCENAEQARQKAHYAAAKAREEACRAAEEERNAMLICMRRNAVAKIIICSELFVCALAVMFFLNWKGIVPPGVHEAICGVIGLVTGLIVNALARAFRK